MGPVGLAVGRAVGIIEGPAAWTTVEFGAVVGLVVVLPEVAGAVTPPEVAGAVTPPEPVPEPEIAPEPAPEVEPEPEPMAAPEPAPEVSESKVRVEIRATGTCWVADADGSERAEVGVVTGESEGEGGDAVRPGTGPDDIPPSAAGRSATGVVVLPRVL